MERSILFKDIPEAVRSSIVTQLRDFSIGFTRATPATPSQRVGLIGSGTLVKAGDRYAILTAHHVVEVLPRTGRLGVLLESSNHMTSLDTGGLRFLTIARGTDDSVGPDLGAVILAEPIASALRAQKRFFDLGAAREPLLKNPPADEHGMWVASGFPDELTSRDTQRGVFHVTFRNQALLGTVERCEVVDGYDYFHCPVDVDDRVNVPDKFNGMSGGGLWQLQLAQKEDGTLLARAAQLSGVIFYQLPTTATQCGLRCHGRQSVYEAAFEAILNGK